MSTVHKQPLPPWHEWQQGCKWRNVSPRSSQEMPKLLQIWHKARTGCQQGENCSFFHPNLCNSSVRTWTCLNKNCTFVHLRSTKRHRDRGEPETGQANRPRHRENNGRSQERPTPLVHYQGNDQRPLPNGHALLALHPSRTELLPLPWVVTPTLALRSLF